MNYYSAKPEEVFKKQIDAVKSYVKDNINNDIFIIQQFDTGKVYYHGKLKSDAVEVALSFDELADSGVYLDTESYITKSIMTTVPSTEWNNRTGKLFISLDALLRIGIADNSTRIKVGDDWKAN